MKPTYSAYPTKKPKPVYIPDTDHTINLTEMKTEKNEHKKLIVAINSLIDVVMNIVQEQATRDHSGLAWGKDVIKELLNIKILLNS